VSECNIKIKLGKVLLEIVSEIKYLGVIIVRNLSFTHVDYLGRNWNEIGAASSNWHHRASDAYMKCVVYKAVIATLLEYCSSSLLSISEINMEYLQKLQNKEMRVILWCNQRISIKEMLEALHFMSVRERVEDKN